MIKTNDGLLLYIIQASLFCEFDPILEAIFIGEGDGFHAPDTALIN
jgi:hypothetical protein